MRKILEKKYMGKKFTLTRDSVVEYGAEDVKKAAVTYLGAIGHAERIYKEIIKNRNADVDFEISIDETSYPSSPQDHYFVANELSVRDVHFTSLAPRFCGEFQKGIDYIGDIDRFREEFTVHARIADTFGYKISIHSGSDKFKVFPYIGQYTGMKFHLKTAGTNWLEAVRTIACNDPVLYRKIHSTALDRFSEACRYYHVGADLSKIPDIENLADRKLGDFLDIDDSRQLLHITYGQILQDRELKKEIYDFLNIHEGSYYDALIKHAGKHLESLWAQPQ
jgi:hypothetical protein